MRSVFEKNLFVKSALLALLLAASCNGNCLAADTTQYEINFKAEKKDLFDPLICAELPENSGEAIEVCEVDAKGSFLRQVKSQRMTDGICFQIPGLVRFLEERKIIVRPIPSQDSADRAKGRGLRVKERNGLLSIGNSYYSLEFNLPMVNHIYSWHQIPFDNDYPHYNPAKPGFDQIVKELRKKDVILMPYTNGRQWDSDTDDFPALGRKAACKNLENKHYTEVYGSGEELVPMCPANRIWQDKMFEVADWLFNTEGVGALYLDQIGSASQCICMDKSHGHPVGGGGFWVDGYRNLLGRIQKLTENTNRFLATEDTAEPYIDNIDAFLTWETRHPNDIPLYAAVYSGMSITFASQVSHKESVDTFAVKVGRDLLWGGQLGWLREWIMLPQFKEQFRFIKHLAEARLLLKEFLSYGEFLGPAQITGAPLLKQTWIGRDKKESSAVVPAALGACWRSAEGEDAVILLNFDNVPHTVDVIISPAHSDKKPVLHGGSKDAKNEPLIFDRTRCRVLLPSREVRVLSFSEDNSGSEIMSELPPRETISGETISGITVPTVTISQGVILGGVPVEIKPRRIIELLPPARPLRSGETRECTLRYSLPPEDKGYAIHLGLPDEISVLPYEVIVPESGKQSGEVKLLIKGGPGLKSATHEINVSVERNLPKSSLLSLAARPLLHQSISAPVNVDGDLSEWSDSKWLVLDGSTGNRINKSRWNGTEDLSVKVATRTSDGMFYLAFDVADDIHHTPKTGEDMWKGDCIQFGFDPLLDSYSKRDGNDIDFAAALTVDGPKLFFWTKRPKKTQLGVKRTEGHTCYEIALPIGFVMTGQADGVSIAPESLYRDIGFSFTCNETDASGNFEGWLEWTPGICGDRNPEKFGMITGKQND